MRAGSSIRMLGLVGRLGQKTYPRALIGGDAHFSAGALSHDSGALVRLRKLPSLKLFSILLLASPTPIPPSTLPPDNNISNLAYLASLHHSPPLIPHVSPHRMHCAILVPHKILSVLHSNLFPPFTSLPISAL